MATPSVRAHSAGSRGHNFTRGAAAMPTLHVGILSRPIPFSAWPIPNSSTAPCSGRCFACQMHPASVPTLYQAERTDGTGSSVQNMMYGAAFAAVRGWNYGGILRNSGSTSSVRELLGAIGAGKTVSTSLRMTGHGQPFDPAVSFFFGTLELIQKTISTARNHTFAIKLKRKFNPATGGSTPMIEEMLMKLMALKDPLTGISAIVLPATLLDLSRFVSLDEFFNPPFRAALRASAACSISKVREWHFTDWRPSVALHVRRGDVTLSRHPMRYTSDEYYYNVAAVIRNHLPNADFHVFSSTRDQFRRGEKNHSIENANHRDVLHPSRSFDGYRQRGMSVHLDGDPLEAAAHLMTAHVVVIAKSAFSWAPAVFNPHCVICPPSFVPKLRHWIMADDMANLSMRLPACIGAWNHHFGSF